MKNASAPSDVLPSVLVALAALLVDCLGFGMLWARGVGAGVEDVDKV